MNTKYISGVSEPFLSQDVRYHCPVYVIFTFKKPLLKTFLCELWLYSQGDFNLFRQFVADFNWDSIKSEDVNQYALNFTDKLINLAQDCIPHKQVRIRPQDLPWINGTIRKLMRKRNRLYKKYKRNKFVDNYESFKDIRNNVPSSLRKSKKAYFKSLADKLKSASLATSDYWKTLKCL